MPREAEGHPAWVAKPCGERQARVPAAGWERRLGALGAGRRASGVDGGESRGTASTGTRYRSVSIENEQIGGCEPLPVPPAYSHPPRDRNRARFAASLAPDASPVTLVEIPKRGTGRDRRKARDTLKFNQLETPHGRHDGKFALFFSTVKQTH